MALPMLVQFHLVVLVSFTGLTTVAAVEPIATVLTEFGWLDSGRSDTAAARVIVTIPPNFSGR
jgi:hypothetical protein